MPTHSIVTSYQAGGTSLAGTVTNVSDTELNIDLTLAASSTDVAVAAPITRAKIISCAFLCSAAATVEVNNGSSPTDTIALTANVPVVAKTQAEAAVLFTGTSPAITNFYITCSAGGSFQFRCLIDNSTNAP